MICFFAKSARFDCWLDLKILPSLLPGGKSGCSCVSSPSVMVFTLSLLGNHTYHRSVNFANFLWISFGRFQSFLISLPLVVSFPLSVGPFWLAVQSYPSVYLFTFGDFTPLLPNGIWERLTFGSDRFALIKLSLNNLFQSSLIRFLVANEIELSRASCNDLILELLLSHAIWLIFRLFSMQLPFRHAWILMFGSTSFPELN